MSVYGRYGGLQSWVFDAIYDTDADMNAQASKILIGRHVISKEGGKISVYQRTVDPIYTLIYDDLAEIQLGDVHVDYTGDGDTGNFDANNDLYLHFGSLRALKEQSESINIGATNIEFRTDGDKGARITNIGFEGGAPVETNNPLRIRNAGAITYAGDSSNEVLTIATEWQTF